MTKSIQWYLIVLLALCSCSNPGKTDIPTIHSEFVNDDFELYIDLPPRYSADSSYAVAFYMDANLKLGSQLRAQIRLKENTQNLGKVIFVGIGHTGNYRHQRRRDFIPPNVENGRVVQSKAVNFGHADAFYSFLTKELIPHINRQYPNNGSYSYIGHSFSGLFAFYAMLQPELVFKNHIAMSPSLWVNYNNFFEMEEAFGNDKTNMETYLYHACGTAEWANKVRSTSRKMKAVLNERAYKGLNYEYVEHAGKGHNGVVPVSLEYVLKNVDF
ncbi:MAG: alpha/beta hydrolase [Roseivirga sp.]|nr:alpha/beta hydrolase [Roseivirga sp.]